MQGWDNFFVAMAGASAALAGLIFVGVSISLTRILAVPALPARASESLVLLLTALIISTLCLVPAQGIYLGIELLFIGIMVWLTMLKSDLEILGKTDKDYKIHAVRNMLFTQMAVFPYIIAGIAILSQGAAGLYWLIPGFIFSFIKAVLDAWVLLVEIHR